MLKQMKKRQTFSDMYLWMMGNEFAKEEQENDVG